jgi:hypothetical protein
VGPLSAAHAATAFLRGGQLFRLGFGVGQLGFQPFLRQRSRNDRAVDEHQRRRRVDAQLLAQRTRRDERRVAIALVIGKLVRGEEIVPCLDPVRRTPDHLGLARGIRMQLIDREQERVNRHIVYRLELGFELRAERTIGIGKNHELALPVALYLLDRQVQWQRVPGDAVQLARPLFGQVLLGVDVVNRTDDDLVRLGVGIDQLVVELRLVQSEVPAFRDIADRGSRKLLLQALLDVGSFGCKRRRRRQ